MKKRQTEYSSSVWPPHRPELGMSFSVFAIFFTTIATFGLVATLSLLPWRSAGTSTVPP